MSDRASPGAQRSKATPDPGRAEPRLEFRPRRRRRSGQDDEPVALADLMVPALARLGLKSKALELQLMNHWPAVVGDMVAEHTSVSLFHRGRLTVTTDSPAMSHALKLQAQDIMSGLNERMGGEVVTGLHFRLARERP